MLKCGGVDFHLVIKFVITFEHVTIAPLCRKLYNFYNNDDDNNNNNNNNKK